MFKLIVLCKLKALTDMIHISDINPGLSNLSNIWDTFKYSHITVHNKWFQKLYISHNSSWKEQCSC